MRILSKRKKLQHGYRRLSKGVQDHVPDVGDAASDIDV